MAEYFTKDGDGYQKVDENLLTQSEVDNVIEKRLDRERGKFADYDELKEKAGKVDNITQEYENKLTEKNTTVEDLNKKLSKAQLETEKVKIVHEFELPDDLAEFVTGDNAEDMRKRAEKLANGTGTGKGPEIKKKGKPESAETDSKKLAKGLFGNKSDD